MISFVSLFLGLVMGYQTVVVQVAEPVTSVEILLDGHRVAVLESPNWSRQIDFGKHLQPHELTAVAFGDEMIELDRVNQWVNLPRQPAETTIILEYDEVGKRRLAKVAWKSLTGEEPSAVRVEFDGRQLEFEDPRAIALPAYDPELLHFLRVELDFAGLVSSTAEITFGGTYADQVNTELTAFPVVPAGGKKLPPEAQLREGFLARGMPLRVAAIEKGQAELVVVRDQGAWPKLRHIRRLALSDAATGTRITRGSGPIERQQWFSPDRKGWQQWTFQFLWPVSRRLDKGSETYDLFSHSAKYSGTSGSLHGWLTTLEQPAKWSGDQRLADAVAIAAVTAAGSNRRRGVLLVLDDSFEDTGEASPAVVMGYLEALAVPLFVWSVSAATTNESAWGPATDVSSGKLMSRATHRLFRELEAQRIVWIDGLHLPQQVTLAPTLEGVGKISSEAVSEAP